MFCFLLCLFKRIIIYFSKPMRLLHIFIFLSRWGCSPNIKLYFSKPLRLLSILYFFLSSCGALCT